MRNYISAATITFLAALMLPTIACTATEIEIRRTSTNLEGAGCGFSMPSAAKPKLVKKLFDEGRYGLFEYEHAAGGPFLILGGIGNGKDWKQVAAMNINGKEMLFDWVKQEPIRCLDEVHHKQIDCTMDEYSNPDIKVVVKRLTSQSACFPDGRECAGDTASALVTIESSSSKKSLVMVGGCGD